MEAASWLWCSSMPQGFCRSDRHNGSVVISWQYRIMGKIQFGHIYLIARLNLDLAVSSLAVGKMSLVDICSWLNNIFLMYAWHSGAITIEFRSFSFFTSVHVEVHMYTLISYRGWGWDCVFEHKKSSKLKIYIIDNHRHQR